MASIRHYSSSREFLEALSPSLIPSHEWQCHLLLGLNQERTAFEDSRDFFAVTLVNGQPQLALFAFYKTPLNISSCREINGMEHFDEQLELLAKFAAEQPTEVTAMCQSITGPEEVVRPFAPLVSRLLSREVKVARELEGSYVDSSTFVSIPKPDPRHIIRPATMEDSEEVSKLVHTWFSSPQHPPPISVQELMEVIPAGIAKGSYHLYTLEDGTVAAAGMLRRSTPNGIGITMVVTGEQHRRRGFGGAMTSYMIEKSLKAEGDGGLGKQHVAIFWEKKGGAKRIYKKIGFVEEYSRLDFRLAPAQLDE